MRVHKIEIGTGGGVWRKKLGLPMVSAKREPVKVLRKPNPQKENQKSVDVWIKKQVESVTGLSETADKIKNGVPISDLERDWHNFMMSDILAEAPYHDPEMMSLFKL